MTIAVTNTDHSQRCLHTPEECKIQIGSSVPLVFNSGRYSKSSESSSGNKSLKVGISWTTGVVDPWSFKIAIVASISGLRSGVAITCWVPVLLMRWATPAAEFLGEIAKATHSARIIPSFVVPYVIVSKASRGCMLIWQSGKAW